MGLKQWPESGKPFFPSVELNVHPLEAICARCSGTGQVIVAVENGCGDSIPCPDCTPDEADQRLMSTLDAEPLPELNAAEREALDSLPDDMIGQLFQQKKIECELADALLRIGTQMANLCMKYGSGPRMTEMLDCQRMLDLDESWHETTAALSRLKARCRPFRTQVEIEAEDAQDDD